MQLLQVDRELVLDPELTEDLASLIVAETGPTSPELRDLDVAGFAYGPRTFEAAAASVRSYVQQHAARLSVLKDQKAVAVLRARALFLCSWEEATRQAGLSDPRVSMRALRRAVRELLELISPSLALQSRQGKEGRAAKRRRTQGNE